MINEALDAIKTELNDFIQLKFGLDEEQVILSNLVDNNGASIIEENKIIITLVNVEEDKAALPKGSYHTPNPPIFLNLYLLFYVYFNKNLKRESLSFLSAIIGFFQSKKVFTSSNTPILDPAIDKLSLEIYNLSFDDKSSLFSFLGAKHSPSIMYKTRMVVIDEGMIKYKVGKISESSRQANEKNPNPFLPLSGTYNDVDQNEQEEDNKDADLNTNH